tara:strand:+ start:210 stop:1625 length:1416 start_codon:yes stop_codon:yes gene_type:complete
MVRRSARQAKNPRINLNEETYTNAIWENKEVPLWSTALEDADTRVARISGAKTTRKATVALPALSKEHKHILFMNPGTQCIHDAMVAITNGAERPAWCKYFKSLSVQNGKLMYGTKAFATSEEKRRLVKSKYFTPDEPSTIQPITDALRGKYCNISRSNVRNILRSLETYQLNFARRRPQKVNNTTIFKNPGVLACDVFMPSAKLGFFGKRICLTVMDVWSRFSRCYVIENKKAILVKQGIERFVKEFTSLGHLPRRMLCDKGTDLGGWKNVDAIMERYRLPRDKDQPMVLRSVTGMPVGIVEAMNSQYQRRMQVFRTSNLTDDPADVLWDISDQLNDQRRPVRGNLTPLQLLALPQMQRNAINAKYKRNFITNVGGLKPLVVGNTVRILQMTRKEQEKFHKQFAPKWSKKKFTVLRRTGLRRNPGVFKYSVGLPNTYYRHELLHIPKKTDTNVPNVNVRNFKLIAESPLD